MKQKSIYLVLISLLFVALEVGCSQRGTTTSVHEKHFSYPDFKTFPTPRTFDAPGTIFRIDREGHKFTVMQLQVPVSKGNEALTSYTESGAWTLKGLLHFLSLHNSKVSSDANMNLNHAVKVKLSGGLRERTLDTDVDAAIQRSQLAFRGDSKYYIIRETIAVSAIDYDFEENVDTNTGVSAQLLSFFRQLPAGKVDYVLSSTSQRSLNLVFKAPHRLFYTVDLVNREAKGLLASEISRTPVNENLIWTEEEQ